METFLNIRETSTEELPWIRQLEKRVENKQWIIPDTPERHQDAIEGKDEFHFTIFSNANVALGFFVLAWTSQKNKCIELRRILINTKGEGIGRYTLKWIKRFCFAEMDVHRLWLDVYMDNTRALGLYLSEGFVREGVMRESILDQGHWRSLYLLSMLESEYTA